MLRSVGSVRLAGLRGVAGATGQTGLSGSGVPAEPHVASLLARDTTTMVDGGALPNDSIMQTAGYATPGDGGHAHYRWVDGDTSDPDGVTILEPTNPASVGRWHLLWADTLSTRVGGVLGGGDETPQINAVLAAAGAGYDAGSGYGGRMVWMPAGVYRAIPWSSAPSFQGIRVQQGVELRGAGMGRTVIMPVVGSWVSGSLIAVETGAVLADMTIDGDRTNWPAPDVDVNVRMIRAMHVLDPDTPPERIHYENLEVCNIFAGDVYTTVEGVRVHTNNAVDGEALDMRQAENVTVRNVYIHDNATTGLSLSGTDIDCEGVRAYRCGFNQDGVTNRDNAAFGIVCYDVERLRLANLDLRENSRGGLNLEWCVDAVVEQALIEDNADVGFRVLGQSERVTFSAIKARGNAHGDNMDVPASFVLWRGVGGTNQLKNGVPQLVVLNDCEIDHYGDRSTMYVDSYPYPNTYSIYMLDTSENLWITTVKPEWQIGDTLVFENAHATPSSGTGVIDSITELPALNQVFPLPDYPARMQFHLTGGTDITAQTAGTGGQVRSKGIPLASISSAQVVTTQRAHPFKNADIVYFEGTDAVMEGPVPIDGPFKIFNVTETTFKLALLSGGEANVITASTTNLGWVSKVYSGISKLICNSPDALNWTWRSTHNGAEEIAGRINAEVQYPLLHGRFEPLPPFAAWTRGVTAVAATRANSVQGRKGDAYAVKGIAVGDYYRITVVPDAALLLRTRMRPKTAGTWVWQFVAGATVMGECAMYFSNLDVLTGQWREPELLSSWTGPATNGQRFVYLKCETAGAEAWVETPTLEVLHWYRGSMPFRTPLYRVVYDYDELLSGDILTRTIGKWGWSFVGTPTISRAGIGPNSQGVVRINTGTTAGAYAGLSATNNASNFDLSGYFESRWYVRPQSYGTGGVITDAMFRCGFVGSTALTDNPPSDAVMLEKGLTESNWFFVVRIGGVEIGRVDTGVALGAAGGRFRVTFYRVDAGLLACRVDDSTEVTIATAGPTAFLTALIAAQNKVATFLNIGFEFDSVDVTYWVTR